MFSMLRHLRFDRLNPPLSEKLRPPIFFNKYYIN